MTITVTHSKISAIPDGADTSVVRPSDWNATHTLVGLGTAAELDAGVANGVATLDASGKVPLTQLSGIVTSVTGTAPVASSGGTTPAISMAAATAAVDGYLTSTDWTTFNSKQTAFGSQTANNVYAAPNGTAGTPTFRALVTADVTGLGTIATQNANSVAITGGSINGTSLGATTAGSAKVTTLDIASGLTLATAAGTSGQVLTSAGAGFVPTWTNPASAGVSSINFGTTGLTPTTATSGAVSVAGTLAIANGGTGATTAGAALTSLGAYAASNPSGYTNNTGTVTNVAMTVPTGLSISGTPITTSGTLALTLTAGYSIPTTASQTTWDSAYSQRLQWDGGATNLVAATGRASLGATTVGGNFFTLANPTAITFPRINADNTVSALDAATFRTAIGAGTSSTSGTVTSVAATVPAFLSVTGSPITSSGTLAISYSGTALPIANGGTNATTANAGFNNLAPTQTSNSGKFLTTNGTNTSWATPAAVWG